MTEQHQGDKPESKTISSRNGRCVAIARDPRGEASALCISTDADGGARMTAYLRDADLKQLLSDNAECCLQCQHSRFDGDQRTLRCRKNPPRFKYPEWPQVDRGAWCAKFKPMIQVASAAVPA